MSDALSAESLLAPITTSALTAQATTPDDGEEEITEKNTSLLL